MQHRVKGRVAHIHTDAILGLDDNQYRRRLHQLEAMDEKGQYRVTGPRVSFKYGEIIDIIDAGIGKSSVLEPIGKVTTQPDISADLRDEADILGIKYGLAIGAKTLKARIDKHKSDIVRIETAAAEDDAKQKKAANAARKKAAKARA